MSGARLLGPVAHRLVSPDNWTDAYPVSPEYANELDELLQFTGAQGRLADFVPRLESKNTQRDEALSELRVAHLFNDYRFPIVQWEPLGLNGKVGEYLIGTPEGEHVFVEVKSPGWEGELSDEERRAGRTKQPKYGQGGGGPLGNWQALRKCIASEKTYPKFAPTQPNLLVVADDFLVSLRRSRNQAEIALYAHHKAYGAGYFTSAQFENLGGVGVFWAFCATRGIEYEVKLFDNPFALPSTKLPASILKFKAKNHRIARATIAG